jgi:hypothetical protein
MSGTEDKIKTTISMDKRTWQSAKLRAVAAGQSVGDYLADLIKRTDDGSLARVHPDAG